jgi:hypothetical protein
MLEKQPEKRFDSMAEVVALIGKPRVNALTVDRVRAHYDLCRRPHLGRFYKSFYRRLVAACPDIERHFVGISWTRQYDMLDLAIDRLLDFDPARPQSRIDEMLGRHARFGLSERHIAKFFESFLATLREFTPQDDPPFDDIQDTWRVVIGPAMSYMQVRLSCPAEPADRPAAPREHPGDPPKRIGPQRAASLARRRKSPDRQHAS